MGPAIRQNCVQIVLRAPFAPCDVLEPRSDEHEGWLAIDEGASHEVRLRISRLRRSMALLAQMRYRCSRGKASLSLRKAVRCKIDLEAFAIPKIQLQHITCAERLN